MCSVVLQIHVMIFGMICEVEKEYEYASELLYLACVRDVRILSKMRTMVR